MRVTSTYTGTSHTAFVPGARKRCTHSVDWRKTMSEQFAFGDCRKCQETTRWSYVQTIKGRFCYYERWACVNCGAHYMRQKEEKK